MLYLLLQLPLGILYFTVAVTGLSVSLALIVAPIFHLLMAIGVVQFDITNGSELPVALEPLVLLAGIVLLPAVMHLFKGIGHVHAQIAKRLLVKPAPAA